MFSSSLLSVFYQEGSLYLSIIQSLSPYLYFCLTPFVSAGWTMLIFLLQASLHHYRSMLRFSFSSLLPECALLHSKSFDVNGNSWLREIWWKVSQPVFIPSQMALNKLREKTQIHFSQKGLIQSTVSDGPIAACNQRWLFYDIFQSCVGIEILPVFHSVTINQSRVENDKTVSDVCIPVDLSAE